ncbi:MAG: bifunctional phosphopantothenoylcysteine decarboxylase/phosphopantothenate--cysteine ligase CoaBC [Thiomonas arsenitoxydans]|uniref:Coenzyme A biosynthesis bifunctional protein CoaBC n=1 Tax=Thiomonas arsenitoxydans (strain DSM 22701 / CIP 110005 / 3As) TaxID=426114 RepID=A0A8I1MUW2_THIA3|nr:MULTISPECIES: bifunctional phosphopantothenoylcysteine decarboxylase/phosphopantothenate--cysteine ligase CoaBC [Thiomonas]MBN8743382.1 bifunctional phosphopantothenoylcysteine decarboxylase/phosphopantothenate--cysteine ligase CoaBC [Thiomonas arsenitoxydans]ODU98454.1 MAG: phosphopantothenate synthase [Thiomonas sp. SCN 64-16]
MDLQGKHIVLAVTGGVAAYKAAELTRLLVQAGATVQVVLTAAGARFVGAATFQALTGRPVFDDLWDTRVGNGMAHIELTRAADLVVVAPATANVLAQAAGGLSDDLLSTLLLASNKPVLFAPAMNREMWGHPATQRNVARLREDGALISGPAAGEQACGEVGEGRMVEPEELLQDIVAAFQPKLFKGRTVLVTAGPTFEAIDPVRGLTNRSSGKMGYAVARAAREAGARVVLVSGPTALPAPHGVQRVDVTSAQEMFDAVMAQVGAAQVFIATAAVADWRPAQVQAQKQKKREGEGAPTIALQANPDILATVAALPQPPFCVGFAAESEKLAEHAAAKRVRKNVPLLVGNLGSDTFGRDDNRLELFDATGHHPLGSGDKLVLARKLINEIAARLERAGL